MSQAQARKLIAGPGVFICNECVAMCVWVLESEGIGSTTEPPGPTAGASRFGSAGGYGYVVPDDPDDPDEG
jgi:hypothetical protein